MVCPKGFGWGAIVLAANKPGLNLSDAAATLSLILLALGLPRSCAKILAVLYLAGRPLTSREIAEITGYSKSTISATTRMLVYQKIVKKLKRDRCDAFTTQVSLSKLLLETQAEMMECALNKIKEIKSKVNSIILLRLDHIENELNYLIQKFREG